MTRTEHSTRSLTHELGRSHSVYGHAVSGRDLLGESKVDELDVESSSTLHDDVVRLNAEVHNAAMMQKLHRIQHLHTQTPHLSACLRAVFKTKCCTNPRLPITLLTPC